jgi:hypothetical protein
VEKYIDSKSLNIKVKYGDIWFARDKCSLSIIGEYNKKYKWGLALLLVIKC